MLSPGASTETRYSATSLPSPSWAQTEEEKLLPSLKTRHDFALTTENAATDTTTGNSKCKISNNAHDEAKNDVLGLAKTDDGDDKQLETCQIEAKQIVHAKQESNEGQETEEKNNESQEEQSDYESEKSDIDHESQEEESDNESENSDIDSNRRVLEDAKEVVQYTKTTMRTDIPKNVTFVEFDLTVTQILIKSFKGCDQLEKINIADTCITTVEFKAFYACSSLKIIQLPPSLLEIGDFAFSHCSSLKNIEIPRTVKRIGTGAFNSCRSLKSITLPESLICIESETFKECESLLEVELPRYLRDIGKEAFCWCHGLQKIDLPETIKKIGGEAFYGCSGLERMKLPASLEKIEDATFCECESLVEVELPPSLREIGDSAFKECALLEKIDIPDGVNKMGGDAFAFCASLNHINIPSLITEIQKGTFYGCVSLKQIQLPQNLKEIGEFSFGDCKSLSAIKIPNGIKYMRTLAFGGCSMLQEVGLPDSLTNIESYAFNECCFLQSIEIPKKVTEIGEGAFNLCERLISVELPATVTVDYAFTYFESREWPEDFDTNSWLKKRWNELPLHRMCHRSDVSSCMLSDCIKRVGESALRLNDEFGMTPLHVLVTNPNVTGSMLEIMLEEYPGAAKVRNKDGVLPLHSLALNRGYCESIKTLYDAYPEAVFEKDGNEDYLIHNVCRSGKSVVSGALDIIANAKNKDGLYAVSFSDKEDQSPTALAVKHNLSEDAQLYLQFLHPEKPEQYPELTDMYLNKLKEKVEKKEHFEPIQQHGLVQFVKDLTDSDFINALVEMIKDNSVCSTECITKISLFKDHQNKSFMDVAPTEIRHAVEDRLLFLARYKIEDGPPIHKSDTSIVVKAFDMRICQYYEKQFQRAVEYSADEELSPEKFKSVMIEMGACIDDTISTDYHEKFDLDGNKKISCEEFVRICKEYFDQGQNRTVAFKFLKREDQFRKEINSRKALKSTEKRCVVGFLETYNAYDESKTKNKTYSNAINDLRIQGGRVKLSDYRFATVMPYGDRNLDTIYRSEQPDIDVIRVYAKCILEKLMILHNENVAHCDLKATNVVRFGGEMQLIDLDAAAEIDVNNRSMSRKDTLAKYYVGAKFSSGTLPPEMIHSVRDLNEMKTIDGYFKDREDEVFREKRQKTQNGDMYAVKTFLIEQTKEGEDVIKNRDTLPYSPVKASQSIDLWSFGTLLYRLITGKTLFDLDRNDDLVDASEFCKLVHWDSHKKKKLYGIKDVRAKALLSKLLSTVPEDRGEIVDILDDCFFSDSLDKRAEALVKGMQTLEENTIRIRTQIDENRKILSKAIFEATEVKTPTCFVILPEKDDETNRKKNETFVNDLLDFVGGEDFFDNATGRFGTEILDRFGKESYYLYLVDEYSHERVTPNNGIYPIKITRNKQTFEESILPVMLLGLKAASLVNKGLHIAQIFLPGLPAMDVECFEKAKKALSDDNFMVITDAINQMDGHGNGRGENEIKVRGKKLRQFTELLEKEDKSRDFCGLRRVCDSEGNAIWTSEENARKYEAEQCQNRGSKLTKKIEKLKGKLRNATERRQEADERRKEADERRKEAEVKLTESDGRWKEAEAKLTESDAKLKKLEERLKELNERLPRKVEEASQHEEWLYEEESAETQEESKVIHKAAKFSEGSCEDSKVSPYKAMVDGEGTAKAAAKGMSMSDDSRGGRFAKMSPEMSMIKKLEESQEQTHLELKEQLRAMSKMMEELNNRNSMDSSHRSIGISGNRKSRTAEAIEDLVVKTAEEKMSSRCEQVDGKNGRSFWWFGGSSNR